jgi:hypothetical protein
MTRFARIPDRPPPAPASIDLDALRSAVLTETPFPFVIVPQFVLASALDGIREDFPEVRHPGSFPLSTLAYGRAFETFIEELRSPEMGACVAAKLKLDLSGCPTMVTVRGQSREADGKIHTDSKTKLVTALIYMNEEWESPRGRLRLVRSPANLDDVVAEVPPERGTLLLFKNAPNAWHGFEPFAGPRRVIQLNWMTNASVVRREEARHRVSAFFKHLLRGG